MFIFGSSPYRVLPPGMPRRMKWGSVLFGTVAICLVWAAATACAGEFNEVLSPGSQAPAWVDLPGVDGKKHSLGDLKATPVVVVVFTCNSCPVAVEYEDRIIALARKYATGPESKVAVVAINVNKVKEDSLPLMKERAEKKGFTFPYLFDDTQKIAKAYGANFTPEFFVLSPDRRVVYQGAFDDAGNPAEVKQGFVVTAIEAALAGQPAKPAETLARGCRIRYVRERK
jgi:peroxiredoxin